MNPLTNVKNQNKLNERELEMGLSGSGSSWHRKYKDSAWIFVGGLPYDLTEGDVICVFSQYGELVNINMVRDKATGKTKGFCFICYADQRSTVLAVDNFNGTKVLGRTLRVDHVENYKVPKDDPKHELDEITKKIREEGIAPKLQSSDDEAQLDVKEESLDVKPLKKKKKAKKEKKKKKKVQSSSEDSDSGSSEYDSRRSSKKGDTVTRINIKQEKEDPAHGHASREYRRSDTNKDRVDNVHVKRERESRDRSRQGSESGSGEKRKHSTQRDKVKPKQNRNASSDSESETETRHSKPGRASKERDIEGERERRQERERERRRERDRSRERERYRERSKERNRNRRSDNRDRRH